MNIALPENTKNIMGKHYACFLKENKRWCEKHRYVNRVESP